MTMDVIFATPIKIQNFNLDTDELSNFCYTIKESEAGRVLSNRGGWQSNDLNLDEIKKNETVTLLIKNIVIELNNFAKELQLDVKICLSNVWINISNNGAYNKSHIHPMSLFSGVYYIKTPLNSGTIEFENPVAPLMLSYLNYWHIGCNDSLDSRLNKDSPISPINMHIQPKPNNILIFPAWLSHQVNVNMSSEDRISIAFNACVEQE
jgi:uncharacterized protein (TIGR02466 family)